MQALIGAPAAASRPAPGRATRRRRRAFDGGFTLVELMVVVVLISILAVIAAPAMRVARDDRLAFDYARQIQQMASRARTRAAARGGAHLLVAGPSGTRGRVWLWEALDNVAAPSGPNPVSSCKGVTQWAPVGVYVPGVTAASDVARIIEGIELDAPGVNVDADIKAAFYMSDIADPTTLAVTPAIAMCVTPNGTAFAAAGTDMANAIANMQAQPAFTGVAEIRITRNRGGVKEGISRNVTLAGAAAARIHSR